MKKEYKLIKQIERRQRNKEEYDRRLIHCLITLKSWGINIYKVRLRNFLVQIKNGNKSWNGDVLRFVMREYRYQIERGPKYATIGYQNICKNNDQEGLPF